jgi:hypothetical protein
MTVRLNRLADEIARQFGDYSDRQVECNAGLIMAAPELLDRLKSMVSGAECECDREDPEHPLCDICWSRQVITKAEGGA